MNRVLGKYTFQDIAYLESNYRHKDIYSVAIHEFMHIYSTKNTYFGMFGFFINQAYAEYLIKPDSMSKIKILSYTVKFLKEAFEITSESISYYSQYAYIKMKNNNEYLEEIEKLKNSDVYKIYKLKRILKLLDREDWKKVVSNNLIVRIGFLALNINILDFIKEDVFNKNNLNNILLNKSLEYTPDERFEVLLEALDCLLKVNDPDNITDEMIIEQANISTQKIEKSTLLKVLNYLKSQYKALNISIKLLEENIKNIESKNEDYFTLKEISVERDSDYLDLVRPLAIKNNYPVIYNMKIDEFDLSMGVFSVIWVLIKDDNIFTLFFDDVALGKRYLFNVDYDECKDIISKYDLPLLFFYEDYEALLEKFPEINEKESFVYLEMPYKDSKVVIEKYISDGREIMLHNLNDDIVFLFVKLRGKSVLVTQHARYTLSSIGLDIQNKIFNYINVDKETRIDGLFWLNGEDWCKYEDLIKSISQKSFFNDDLSSPGLGHRITINGIFNNKNKVKNKSKINKNKRKMIKENKAKNRKRKNK